jgi:hypothetical protein
MNGGGLRLLAPGLTNADAIAHAIIGAARAAGLDPVEAITTTDRAKNSPARCVPAAINALAESAADRVTIARILGRNLKTVEGAGFRQSPFYLASLDGARRAVEAASVQAKLAWAVPVEPEARARARACARACAGGRASASASA